MFIFITYRVDCIFVGYAMDIHNIMSNSTLICRKSRNLSRQAFMQAALLPSAAGDFSRDVCLLYGYYNQTGLCSTIYICSINGLTCNIYVCVNLNGWSVTPLIISLISSDRHLILCRHSVQSCSSSSSLSAGVLPYERLAATEEPQCTSSLIFQRDVLC